MNGLLLIDKPVDWTSHDVVAKVRSILRQTAGQKIKVGHAGTLDPFATGLLVVLVGSYTKRANEFLKLDKSYEVTMKLGETSTTGDPEGEKLIVSSEEPGVKEIQKVLKTFEGEIVQTPPVYSALKVKGQRAYALARAGKPVKLEPRKVKIYELRMTRYQFPKVSLEAKVSSGTYIRTLVEDIGQALDTGAYCKALRRISIGDFSIENAYSITQLSAEQLESKLIR